MKKILNHLFEQKTFGRDESKEILTNITLGKYNASQMAAFMAAYCMRNITVEELEGFRDGMLELCLKADLHEYELIDLCGTGGDGKDTFNISTLASFVVAGAGYKVSKHGNYGVSSGCGSSNVMEYLGYTFSNDTDHLKRSLDNAGICFLHAPLFHPALKTVGPLRRNMGVRTFFNMLGPIVNPAQPKFQLIGVYNLEMARIYNYVLQLLDKEFTIIHSLDGYDEISLTTDTKILSNTGESIRTPYQLGKKRVFAAELEGGDTVAEAAAIFKNIIEGKGTWSQNAVVLANAAMALHVTGKYDNYDLAFQAAVNSLESGAANNCLKTLISLQ
jgi:anthranilate phosphoribosyltransferase